MRRRVLFFSLATIACLVAMSACNGDQKKNPSEPVQVVKEQYQCPMKCTDQLFDKPGKCPVCDMELEKITNS